MTILSEVAYGLLRRYLEEEQPRDWLFPGQNRKGHLGERAVQKVFEQSYRASGLSKPASVHTHWKSGRKGLFIMAKYYFNPRFVAVFPNLLRQFPAFDDYT